MAVWVCVYGCVCEHKYYHKACVAMIAIILDVILTMMNDKKIHK